VQACHVALAEPQQYLGGSADMGAGAAQEDACIAYKLFLTVRDWRQMASSSVP